MQRGVACGMRGTDAPTTSKDAPDKNTISWTLAHVHRCSLCSYFVSAFSWSILSCAAYSHSLGTLYSNHLPCVYPLFTFSSLLRCGVFGPEELTVSRGNVFHWV